MTYPIFPDLKGRVWGRHKKPLFATNVAQHVSGRSVRAAFYTAPIWQFEVQHDGLTDQSVTDDYQTLCGLFLACQGQALPFLYRDPADNAANNQVLGIGDGVTTEFAFVRDFGGFIEVVGQVSGSPATSVSVGGTVQATGWTVSGNMLNFTTAPASGLSITASFGYFFLCCFSEDSQDYTNFMYRLWDLKSCKFTSIRL